MLTMLPFLLAAPKAATPIVVKRVAITDQHVINVAPGAKQSQVLVSLEDNTVLLMDASSRAVLRKFPGHPQPVFGIAENKAGTLVATGDETARIWLWDVKTGKKVREFTRNNAHTRGILSLTFSPDGKQIASTGRDDFMIIWDVATGKPVRKIPGDGANVASGTYNPKTIAFYAATLGEGLKIYNRKTWTAAGNIDAHGGQGALEFAISPSGGKGATGGKDNNVAIYDLAAKKKLAVLKGHEDWVLHVAFSPNGRLVASSSSDRTVRVWDLNGFKPLATFQDESSIGSPVCFTPDGKYLVTTTVADQLQVNSVTPSQ
ncbi:MAG: WD40 repeat domain-containing protein [Armatimonadetes bacterium]|nr:WD40 repeat domain-containing protein [Armatimonadota bacterium]